jgi:hypothetical protein
MELCSLEDAFPNINTGSPFVGGKDSYSSREERKAAKRKAKRCKKVAPGLEAYAAIQVDPDRPSVVRAEAVPAMDRNSTEGFKPPVLPGSACTFSDPGYPEYFGKSQEDLEEPFSAYSNLKGDDPNYVLQPGLLAGAFDGKGVDKATGGVGLPAPNINDTWKPLTESGSPTSFTSLPSAISAIPGWFTQEPAKDPEKEAQRFTATTVADEETDSKVLPMPPAYLTEDEKRAMYARIDALQRQLSALEEEKAKTYKSSQAETLVLVGAGIGILMALDVLCYLS